MNKRTLILSIAMLACFAAGAYAHTGVKKIEAFLRPDFHVIVDGKQAELEHSVLIYEDRSYVPLRQIGELLNAQVNWDEKTSSIYIQPFVTPGQEEGTGSVTTIGSITLQVPIAYELQYLGSTYTVLTNRVQGAGEYYRAQDLDRMGVDTRGLRKAKEKYTKELYIHEDEVAKVWKQTPQRKRSYQPVFTGIKDEGLRTKLQEMIADFTLIPSAGITDEEGNMYYYTSSYIGIYSIDQIKADGNRTTLIALGIDSGRFYHFKIVMNKQDEKWFQVSTTKIDIQSLAEQEDL